MTVMQSLKLSTLIMMLLSCFASKASSSDREKYLASCFSNASVFSVKQEKVRLAVESLSGIQNYIVLKHGAASEWFYGFTLVATGENNDAYFVYMDDTIIEPVMKKLDYKLAQDLINGGGIIFEPSQPASFYTKGVNGVPCFFFATYNEGKRKSQSFAGRTNNPYIKKYISKIEKLALSYDLGKLDDAPVLSAKMKASSLSFQKLFAEIESLN
ncbi:hypothetical protein [Pseudoalteromonas ardens]|uniref:DUF4384 domain-containing protein n=1 Tax=Pseudoalteromonas rubra TaxID=43658 RepID=A0A0L0EPG9_9GAMM|nr:hypothetical protein [Pseudoalteromonas sp. R96]KNC66270.1 hypothetical protein AC626_18025 [Pseudoalteromonas rubra]MDK1311970.1 hypothetical protein [Pseudoalteromonas sp. R96]